MAPPQNETEKGDILTIKWLWLSPSGLWRALEPRCRCFGRPRRLFRGAGLALWGLCFHVAAAALRPRRGKPRGWGAGGGGGGEAHGSCFFQVFLGDGSGEVVFLFVEGKWKQPPAVASQNNHEAGGSRATDSSCEVAELIWFEANKSGGIFLRSSDFGLAWQRVGAAARWGWAACGPGQGAAGSRRGSVTSCKRFALPQPPT